MNKFKMLFLMNAIAVLAACNSTKNPKALQQAINEAQNKDTWKTIINKASKDPVITDKFRDSMNHVIDTTNIVLNKKECFDYESEDHVYMTHVEGTVRDRSGQSIASINCDTYNDPDTKQSSFTRVMHFNVPENGDNSVRLVEQVDTGLKNNGPSRYNLSK